MKIKNPKKHSKPKSAKNPMADESSSDLPTYASMAQCAGATGITLAVLKGAKRAGCPAFDAANRVSLLKFLKWSFSELGQHAELDWGGEFKKWQAKREKIKFDKEWGTSIDAVEAKEASGKIMAILFAGLDRIFKNELPPMLKGLDEISIRRISDDQTEKLKDLLREEFKVGKQPESLWPSEEAQLRGDDKAAKKKRPKTKARGLRQNAPHKPSGDNP